MKNLTTKKLESTVGGCQWGDCPQQWGPTIFLPPLPFPIPGVYL